MNEIILRGVYFILGMVVAGIVLTMTPQYGAIELRNKAIELNYAQHNPKTGDFEWIEVEQNDDCVVSPEVVDILFRADPLTGFYVDQFMKVCEERKYSEQNH